ncbi:MAG: hypothetical protein C4297_03935 [Gemmataceae bacterium]
MPSDVSSPQLVPKLHPLLREATAEDPWQLTAVPLPGDPLVMLDSILSEYIMMGVDPRELLNLFSDPSYPVLHALLRHFGEAFVAQRIETFTGPLVQMRYNTVINDHDSEIEQEDALELIAISVKRRHQ